MRPRLTCFHVEGGRVASAKDGADGDDQAHAPDCGKYQSHEGVVKDSMKCCRDIVCELEYFLLWVGDPEIP